jgi:ComF family protein
VAAGLDLLLPPSCAYCGDEFEPRHDRTLCDRCRGGLLRDCPACRRCGASVGGADDDGGCSNCRDQRLYFDEVVRLGVYHDDLRIAALRIKRQHERALAFALGELMVSTVGQRLAAMRPDAVVPVPMHWSRRLLRGVNSPQIIAERIATHLQIPMAPRLLVRRRRTAPQAELSPPRRKTNVRGAFRAARHPDLPGARLLVVDDIMTTGATANEVAKTLKKSGAASVSIAVLARA